MVSAAGSKACCLVPELVDRLKILRRDYKSRQSSDISHIAQDATLSAGSDKPYDSSNPQYQQPQIEIEYQK